MLLDEYGVLPWQMERFTGRELAALSRHHRDKQQREQADGDA